MELGLIIKYLLEVKSILLSNQVKIEFFVFGSILIKGALPSDIDLLVIYQDDNDPITIRHELKPLCMKYPVDLTFMTVSEELELNFIMRTRAINIDSMSDVYAT
jgi:predicted nucleotidyltransferase